MITITPPHLEALRSAQGAAAPSELLLAQMRRAAASAPSADNVQPWHLDVNPATHTLTISVDRLRDTSPLNAGQRMSYIACGAAVENAVQLARAAGCLSQLHVAPWNAAEKASVAPVASIGVSGTTGVDDAAMDARLSLCRARVTNRRTYDGQPVASSALKALADATPLQDGLRTYWIDDRGLIGKLTPILARGDAIMFGQKAVRDAFLNTVRFDLPARAAADEGMPLGALEVSRFEHVTLSLLKYIPNALFAGTGGPQLFSLHARDLVRSASGICVVCADSAADDHPVQVGRAMQRAWLALTQQGLAAQPMMSVPGLDNALKCGSPDLIAALTRKNTPRLVATFKAALRGFGVQGEPAFLLRFGHAGAPSARTGRKE